jgi:hypothetical protein
MVVGEPHPQTQYQTTTYFSPSLGLHGLRFLKIKFDLENVPRFICFLMLLNWGYIYISNLLNSID